MSATQNRILFLRETLTRGEVQRITGIHWNRQESILRGTRFPVRSEVNSIYSMYRVENYSRLRDTGFSVSQASRFRGGSIDTSRHIMGEIKNVIEDLAKGVTVKKIEFLKRKGQGYNEDLLHEQSIESVKEGFRHSKKTVEQWLEYGKA